MKARSARAKGNKLEKFVMDFFNKLPGWIARKQPGSGIYQDFPHDVYAKHEQLGSLILECKHWKHGWRTGDNAMGMADILVIKRNHGEPMAYLSLETLGMLIEGLRAFPTETEEPANSDIVKPNNLKKTRQFSNWPKRQIQSRGFERTK